jgi:predicted RecB family nuclease
LAGSATYADPEVLCVIVNSQIFESYLQCPTKCWLLLRNEPPTGNSYADWVDARNETYFQEGLKRLFVTFPEGDRTTSPQVAKNPKNLTWRLAINLHWKTTDAESCLQVVERIPASGRGRPANFIPYRFVASNKITKEHKLLLALDGLLLSELLGREVNQGKIMHGDNHATLNVNILPFTREVRRRINDATTLLTENAPPDLVLNRHCGQCQFQGRCRTQAREQGELSLLSGMSEKERKKLHGKGIFTVTQLSYTFRPRRRRRGSRGKREKYHQSLRALAIRKNTIHAVGLPALKFEGTPVFLDVEGIPDRDFYYLIGISFEGPERVVQRSFWAGTEKEEEQIWNDFLDALSQIVSPQLFHYGSYETIFLKRMCERHGHPPEGSQVAAAIYHPINLLSFIYAQVYFPTYSNGLKEIAGYLGFQWRGSVLSGTDSIVWRYRWEASKDPELAQALIDYNREDCEALEFLTTRLANLHQVASDSKAPQQEVVLTSDMESTYRLFKRVQFSLPDMETINNAAYWDYQRERVYVKSRLNSPPKSKRRATKRDVLSPNTTAEYSRPASCPNCNSDRVYKHVKTCRTVIDLRFTKHGIKRWVTRHIAHRYQCLTCRSTFFSADRRFPKKQIRTRRDCIFGIYEHRTTPPSGTRSFQFKKSL